MTDPVPGDLGKQLTSVLGDIARAAQVLAHRRLLTAREGKRFVHETERWLRAVQGNCPDDADLTWDDLRLLFVRACREALRTLGERVPDEAPRGGCGMRYHHPDCDCDGVGGER